MENLRVALRRTWADLVLAAVNQEARAARQRSIQQLETARQTDPGIAELCEELENWKGFAGLATSSAVCDQARSKAAKLEQLLNELYPGACTDLQDTEEPPPAVTLPIVERAEPCGADVMLPIPPGVWNSIREGETGAEETVAMRLAWHLAKWSNESGYEARFLCSADGVIMRLATSGERQVQGGEVLAALVSDEPATVVALTPARVAPEGADT